MLTTKSTTGPAVAHWKMTKLRPRAAAQPKHHKRSGATNFSEWLVYRLAQEGSWICAACSSRRSLLRRRTLTLARAALECAESATASMPQGARGACCNISHAELVGGALPTSPTASPPGAMPTSPGASPFDGPSAQLHPTIAEGSRRFQVPIRWQSQAHVCLANAVRRLRIPCLDNSPTVFREASAHHLLPVRCLQRRSQALLPILSCRAMADAGAEC